MEETEKRGAREPDPTRKLVGRAIENALPASSYMRSSIGSILRSRKLRNFSLLFLDHFLKLSRLWRGLVTMTPHHGDSWNSEFGQCNREWLAARILIGLKVKLYLNDPMLSRMLARFPLSLTSFRYIQLSRTSAAQLWAPFVFEF